MTELTAVELFAEVHEAGLAGEAYRALLPATPPGPGQQYGFEVDLDRCTGCKACVTACHSLNGLDADESWRSVGLLIGVGAGEPYHQTVPTGCHHCVEPACLAGCPVDAYEKDPATGIVVHLDDQCIGCSYCTLTCPYEVPRYNASRGIVRKCDLCRGRLESGEAPACAQACPSEAIRVSVVDVAVLQAEAASGTTLVPGAPPSSKTVPSTRYRTTRAPTTDVRAADHFVVRHGHGHPPLAVMLVLTQLAVGAFVGNLVVSPARVTGALLSLAAGLLALAASVLHLGRPAKAWRAVIGIRHSWLSREVVAFGAFASAAAVYAAGVCFGRGGAPWVVAVGVVAAASGIAGVGCSVLIYAVTGRTWWRVRFTGPRFALTTALCGMGAVAATTTSLVWPLVAPTVAGLAWEASILRHRRRGVDDDLARTALLLSGELRRPLVARLVLGALGGVAAPLLGLAWVGLVVLVAGEMVDRWLFFTAVSAPRMPGALR